MGRRVLPHLKKKCTSIFFIRGLLMKRFGDSWHKLLNTNRKFSKQCIIRAPLIYPSLPPPAASLFSSIQDLLQVSQNEINNFLYPLHYGYIITEIHSRGLKPQDTNLQVVLLPSTVSINKSLFFVSVSRFTPSAVVV